MIFTKDDTIWYRRSSSAGCYRVWWTMLMVINQIPVWQTVSRMSLWKRRTPLNHLITRTFFGESARCHHTDPINQWVEATDSKPTNLHWYIALLLELPYYAIWMLVTWQCYPCISILIIYTYLIMFIYHHDDLLAHFSWCFPALWPPWPTTSRAGSRPACAS